MTHWIQRFTRLWHHRWTEGRVQSAFPPEVLQRLERAVAASEAQHTSQIRLCVEGGLPYSYIWRGDSARERALGLFGKLRTWDTEHNNGVLIYLLLAENAIEIIADRAAARVVSQAAWDDVVYGMQQSFQNNAYADGMEAALQKVSALMTLHFPRHSQTANDSDQGLPDAPVVQGRFFKDR